MRLTGVFARVFDFTGQDRSQPAQLISSPYPKDSHPAGYAHCDVPYFHQTHINMCGDACLNMLLAYKGKPHQARFDRNPRKIFDGLDFPSMKKQLAEVGMGIAPIVRPPTRSWAADTLAQHINEYGPIICAGRERGDIVHHYMLLIGVSDEQVLIHDPWVGPKREWALKTFNDFLDWNDSHFMVAGCDPASEKDSLERIAAVMPDKPCPMPRRSTLAALMRRQTIDAYSLRRTGSKSPKIKPDGT